jgi:hypothetical protein
MKTALIIIGVVVLIVAVGAGSFWAGMTYQSNQDSRARQKFMSERGLQEGQLPGQGAPGDRQFFGGGAGSPGGGTMGVIKTIEGNTMTISTAENVTTVHLADDTPVQTTQTSGIEDLQAGMRVMVIGEQDKSGDITARQVTIMDDNFPGAGEPSPMP